MFASLFCQPRPAQGQLSRSSSFDDTPAKGIFGSTREDIFTSVEPVLSKSDFDSRCNQVASAMRDAGDREKSLLNANKKDQELSGETSGVIAKKPPMMLPDSVIEVLAETEKLYGDIDYSDLEGVDPTKQTDAGPSGKALNKLIFGSIINLFDKYDLDEDQTFENILKPLQRQGALTEDNLELILEGCSRGTLNFTLEKGSSKSTFQQKVADFMSIEGLPEPLLLKMATMFIRAAASDSSQNYDRRLRTMCRQLSPDIRTKLTDHRVVKREGTVSLEPPGPKIQIPKRSDTSVARRNRLSELDSYQTVRDSARAAQNSFEAADLPRTNRGVSKTGDLSRTARHASEAGSSSSTFKSYRSSSKAYQSQNGADGYGKTLSYYY
jgi:hypothetical protein